MMKQYEDIVLTTLHPKNRQEFECGKSTRNIDGNKNRPYMKELQTSSDQGEISPETSLKLINLSEKGLFN